MTNEEKAKELARLCNVGVPNGTLEAKIASACVGMAQWKDDRIQHVIACATANLITTLKHCGLFTDESIAKCAEEFKNDLIKEATKGE